MSEESANLYSTFNGFLQKKKNDPKASQSLTDETDVNIGADALVEGKEGEDSPEVKSLFVQNAPVKDEPEEEVSDGEKEEDSDGGNEKEERKETEENPEEENGEEETEAENLTQRVEEYLGGDDEEENDDEEYLTPEEEKLYYSSDENSVSFDDLNNGNEGNDDDEEDENAPPPKMDVSQLTGNKKKFMSGKPKKGLILGVLGGILALLFLTLEAKKIASERKEAQEASKRVQNINTGEYSPDFGDYEARAYKPTAQDQAASEANYTEALLNSGEKRPFEEETAVNKGSTSPSYQTSSSSSSGTGGGGSSAWQDAMTSPIRYQSFNGSTGSGGLLDTITGGNTGSYYPQGYGASYNPVTGYADGYSEILGELTGQNNGGTGYVNNRQFNAGQTGSNTTSSYQSIPENSVYPGTVIHAVMVSGINTDYPAPITARVIENVYDSKTGKKLLIPSGSILRGSYSSASLGVNRVEIAWTELVINRDGKDWLVNLGNMAGVDRSGYSGIKGTLNEHAFAYVKAMGWASLFTYMNSNIYTYTKAQKSQTQRQMIEDSQDIANRLTDRVLDRALDIEPTIRVKPGTKVSVAVDRVVTLSPYEGDKPVKKYVRK